jgi:hypothetical protein
MPSVTRPAQTNRSDQREATEQRQFAATEELVREGSFTEVSVERLAAAGISRSTFCVHFQDKGDLVRKLSKTVLTLAPPGVRPLVDGATTYDPQRPTRTIPLEYLPRAVPFQLLHRQVTVLWAGRHADRRSIGRRQHATDRCHTCSRYGNAHCHRHERASATLDRSA